MNELEIRQVTSGLVERYSRRYRDLGKNIKTLGWGSSEQQRFRFSVSLSILPDLTGKHVLDIGCGFGDFYAFLVDCGIKFAGYTGIDINDDLLSEARKSFPEKNVEFRNLNLLTDNAESLGKPDVAVMFGILNFRFPGEFDNWAYSRLFISRAFEMCGQSLLFDYISTQRDEAYPLEDFIYYHDPKAVLEFCSTLTPFYAMRHDYASIPQREGMVLMSKKEQLG